MREAESHLELVPQEPALQNSATGPGEQLSHIVKEESDTEPKLGEVQLLFMLVRGGFLEKVGVLVV